MSVSEDLINFDIIETQKENIQALPQGRSAKALASTFAPSPFSPLPTPGATRNLNDTFRAEYEAELQTIDDSDDPLDIYDRYVKWTFNAYPTAQATPESQLRPLLERATRAFQNTPTYKNDPRYLKLWIHYIRLFSDAPREVFAYLSRHGIGEGLALFYEEFAVWLEGAGRWIQAEEIYKLGIEREARPSERLLRKFGEFQKRYEARPHDNEPSSPALPSVRPALAAKLDPYAAAPRTDDPQAQRLPNTTTTSKPGRQKIAIFADADGSLAGKPESSDKSRGWDNIGSIQDRKKENTIEAKPWAGETLKAGKRVGTVPKMAIFRDQSASDINANVDSRSQAASTSPLVNLQNTVNPKTGRIERIKAQLAHIYPTENDEYCFSEVISRQRGLSGKDWSREAKILPKMGEPSRPREYDNTRDVSELNAPQEQTVSDATRDITKPRRKKVKEVKGETQTVKLNLSSPTSTKKVRRKSTAEPTMTLHSRAATDEVLDMFNQTLRNVDSITDEPSGLNDSDYDDDDYTSGGESTATGRMSGTTSEYGEDTEALDDMTKDIQNESTSNLNDEPTETQSLPQWANMTESILNVKPIDTSVANVNNEVKTPDSPNHQHSNHFLPSPPNGIQAPTHPFRNAEQVNQNRLPFMTPIVEMTESSLGMPSTRRPGDYFTSKTPSRRRGDAELATTELTDIVLDENMTDIHQLSKVEEETQADLLVDLRNESEITNNSYMPVNEERTTGVPLVELEEFSVHGNRLQSDMTQESLTRDASDELTSAIEQLSILDSSNIGNSHAPRSSLKAIGRLDRDVVVFDDHVNPIDETMRQKIITTLQPPLSSYPGYHDHKPNTSTIKADLDKLSKSNSRRAKSIVEKPGVLEHEPVLRTSEQESITVKQLLGKGGWASVFLVETNSDGQAELQAMKSEFDPSSWEYYVMVLAQARLLNSQQPEVSKSIARPLSFHSYTNAGYMFEDFHEQGNLLELVNMIKADALPAGSSSGASNPGIDEHLAMFFGVEILRTVSALHSVGILHCDVKADNFLVRLRSLDESQTDWSPVYSSSGETGWSSKGIVLIDFGRAIDTLAFKPDTCFYAEWATDSHDCPEQRQARPWTFQADLWGIASILSVLLFGKVLEESIVEQTSALNSTGLPISSTNTTSTRRYKPRDAFKRYWQTELWTEVFDVLMNPALHATQSERVGRGTGGIKGLPATKLRLVQEKMEAFLIENAEKKGLKQSLKKLEEKLAPGIRKR